MSVKLYSTPSCGYCQMAKSFFRERNIKFTEYNVASDTRKAEEMVHKSRQQGVPVIDYNGKIIVGFNRAKIERLINK
jgi:glutaredoxin-like YruB-family protein